MASIQIAFLLQLIYGSSAAEAVRDYCIVGAGPAGIQLGHFLYHAGRDYVIYERNPKAGSFFAQYPRHRGLISLNKRFVRKGRSEEFAFRHDWNSLIDVRDKNNRTAPMTTRSTLLFPQADTLEQYLVEFSEEQEQHIEYNTTVLTIRRPAESSQGFLVKIMRSARSNEIKCREVIIASGLFRPRGVKTRVDGAEYVEGYEDLPTTGEKYEGKSVIVMGLGNAAMETAQELQKYTAELHVFGRSRPLPEGGTGVRLAYETHYVGDIRAGRTTILDTYLLKSLDTFDFTGLEGRTRLDVIPCLGRLCVFKCDQDDCVDEECLEQFAYGGQGLNYWHTMATFVKGGRQHDRIVAILNEHTPTRPKEQGWTFESVSYMEREREQSKDPDIPVEDGDQRLERRKALGVDEGVYNGMYFELRVSSKLLRAYPGLIDALQPLREEATSDNLRFPMDHIIRCFGWAMDTKIFDLGTIPLKTTHKGKYPSVHSNYEAVGVPGLYFAGTLLHGLDFRKSAGGFIHGFRYTSRVLFRLLEESNFGVQWPHVLVPLSPGSRAALRGTEQLAAMLLDRINNASSPYQMFQALGDMIVFEEGEHGNWSARFLEEVPLDYFDSRYRHLPRLTWTFKYSDTFHGKKVLGQFRVGSNHPTTSEFSKFLHPHFLFFNAGEDEPSMRHWISEDVFTHWAEPSIVSPLTRFVARAAAAATGDDLLQNAAVSPKTARRENVDSLSARFLDVERAEDGESTKSQCASSMCVAF